MKLEHSSAAVGRAGFAHPGARNADIMYHSGGADREDVPEWRSLSIANNMSLCYEYVALMKSAVQLALPLGAARPGRRSTPTRVGAAHRARSSHCRRHPAHVTLRRVRALPSMREQSLFLSLRRAFAQTARSWFRVVQFSVQADHVHLMVEADDKRSLSRGMTGVSVRLARAFNRALGRHGAVWSERYHSRDLRTPREVRNALVYVLMNRRKHTMMAAIPAIAHLDVCSSARWFDGWAVPPSSEPPSTTEVPPVVPPETWLARKGWKVHGLIRIEESPKRDRRSR
jgi:putative transposase